MGLVNDMILPLRPHMSDKSQLRWLRGVNFATGAAAVLAAFVLPDVFSILVLAYSFWCPHNPGTPGRRFPRGQVQRPGVPLCAAGGADVHPPVELCPGQALGVDGTMVGMLCNFLVFTACTKAYQRYDVQKSSVWK